MPGGPALLLSRHRRALAGALAALAVLAVVSAVRTRPAGVPVLVAARGLPSGARLGPADVRTVSVPAALVPDGALRSPVTALGALLAGAVEAGEPITADQLLSPLDLPPGEVAAPVRLADPAVAGLLAAGDRIDLLAGPRLLAGAAAVLGVPGGGLILVAVSRRTAAALAAASTLTADLVDP